MSTRRRSEGDSNQVSLLRTNSLRILTGNFFGPYRELNLTIRELSARIREAHYGVLFGADFPVRVSPQNQHPNSRITSPAVTIPAAAGFGPDGLRSSEARPRRPYGLPAIRSGCSSHRPPAALSYSGFDRGGESAVLALEVRRHLGALAVLLVEAHLPALTVRIVGGCAMNWAREIGSHGADNQHYRRRRSCDPQSGRHRLQSIPEAGLGSTISKDIFWSGSPR